MSCPSIRIAPALHVVEALQQRQHGGLAGARERRPARRAGPARSSGRSRRSTGGAARIGEAHMLERDPAGAAARSRAHPARSGSSCGDQQGADRFLQPRDVLRQIDQRHRQVARAVQDAERQRGDQHDVADRRLAVLPQQDAPSRPRRRSAARSAPHASAAAVPDNSRLRRRAAISAPMRRAEAAAARGTSRRTRARRRNCR